MKKKESEGHASSPKVGFDWGCALWLVKGALYLHCQCHGHDPRQHDVYVCQRVGWFGWGYGTGRMVCEDKHSVSPCIICVNALAGPLLDRALAAAAFWKKMEWGHGICNIKRPRQMSFRQLLVGAAISDLPLKLMICLSFLQKTRCNWCNRRKRFFDCEGMEIIRLAGYVYEEKLAIANQHLGSRKPCCSNGQTRVFCKVACAVSQVYSGMLHVWGVTFSRLENSGFQFSRLGPDTLGCGQVFDSADHCSLAGS